MLKYIINEMFLFMRNLKQNEKHKIRTKQCVVRREKEQRFVVLGITLTECVTWIILGVKWNV